MATQGSLTQKLVDIAGDVLLEAAKFGLDLAGERILGSKGWDGFKRILSPVVSRLQEEFPALRFGRDDDPQAAQAAGQAAAYLENSPELQGLLSAGFMSLQEGQGEILASIDRMERLMTAHHNEQMKLLKEMNEQLGSSAGLPKRVDVTDVVDRVFLLSRIRARHEGREFNQNVSGFIATAAGAGVFVERVLEQGNPFVRYETKIADQMYYATPSAQFTDNSGRPCRKVSTDTPVWGEPHKRISVEAKHCKEEGDWGRGEVLEQREYLEQ